MSLVCTRKVDVITWFGTRSRTKNDFMPYFDDELVCFCCVPGIGTAHNNFFFFGRFETSALVTVSGLSCAGSLHVVFFPGAAPVSTKPDLISRKASCRNLVR